MRQKIWLRLAALCLPWTAGFIPAGAAETGGAAEKAFAAVDAALDHGGVRYGFFDYTEGRAIVTDAVEFIGKLPDVADHPLTPQFRKVAAEIVNVLGLNAIDACGYSLVKRNGVYTAKQVFYAPPAARKGLFWEIPGREAHAFTLAERLPADTAGVMAVDIDFAALLKTADSIAAAVEGADQWRETLGQAKAAGVDLEQLLPSIKSLAWAVGGHFTDDLRQPREWAVMLETTDGGLLTKLAKIAGENGLPLTEKDGRFTVATITIWQQDGWIVITDSADKIAASWNDRDRSLAADAAFRATFKGLPEKGNVFAYGRGGNLENLKPLADKAGIRDLAAIEKLLALDRPSAFCGGRADVGYLFAYRCSSSMAYVYDGNPAIFPMLLIPAGSGVYNDFMHRRDRTPAVNHVDDGDDEEDDDDDDDDADD